MMITMLKMTIFVWLKQELYAHTYVLIEFVTVHIRHLGLHDLIDTNLNHIRLNGWYFLNVDC